MKRMRMASWRATYAEPGITAPEPTTDAIASALSSPFCTVSTTVSLAIKGVSERAAISVS